MSEILNISKHFKNQQAKQKTCKAYNKLWAVGIILQNKMGHPAHFNLISSHGECLRYSINTKSKVGSKTCVTVH